MRNECKLTAHRKGDRQWLDLLAVKAMARALLGDAIRNGTTSWDFTIFKTFSLVLVSALGARGGDVTLSRGYTNEYLRYKHIRVVMFDKEDGGKVVGMHVEMAYSKGYK